ncbi:hypothetical protein [Microbacterium stercoris]|uniref:DUF3558 domain-containing protein n=1 Tax=Microbacterium stercoris TaxID=2820289 RepID=A0A939QI21_9MICO|nr:hypothetical protein [Microbacterium stercoris]MBO3663304.1 hypothetical protein [Microbacterium stercoris]
MRRVLPAVVLLAGSLALAACSPQPSPEPTTAPTPAASTPAKPTTPAPTETESAPPSAAPTEPTAEPAPPATDGPAGLPANCAQAYSPGMQDRLHAAFAQLNPGRPYAWSSKIADLLDVIQGAPNLNCDWSPGGDVFLTQNAAIAPAQHDQLVRDALTRDFPGCDATGAVVDCQRELDRQQDFHEYERVVLDGDLLLTTYAANVDKALVDDAISDMRAILP